MAALPSYTHYLSPGDLHVTLSIRSQSSINDDTSIINEDHIERSSPPTPEKRSGPHNLRREGYSEEKCRYVLVKYCSSIPRNFNYAEGVQLVYEKLREHCGDENLDLSIGVLYEFIEVDTEFTFEQGAAFRRWQFDHSRRAGDFTNNHAPRMGNIIVGNIIPTERLRQWRIQNPERQRGTKLSDSDLINLDPRSPVATGSPHFGIAHRSAWHIENTLYVSSRTRGTTVLYCPTPQEAHERAWNESYGRGGKLVRQRLIGFDAISPMEILEPDAPKVSRRRRVLENLLRAWTGSLHRVSKIGLTRDRFGTLFILRAKSKSALNRYQHCSVPVYEALQEVINLPDQDTKAGKVYYRNIKTTELPPGVGIPNAMFARKHGLDQVSGHPNRMGSVEDLAIMKCLEANHEARTQGKRWSYRGPLTASLFKDGGIDYQWEVSDTPVSGPSRQTRSDPELSRDSYFSLEEAHFSDLSTLKIPAAPARSQRARSQSRRALQGGDDIIQHDAIDVAIDGSYRDAARPYAVWKRSGTEAHLFSGNSKVPEVEEDSSTSHFDKFAAQLQSKFNTPKPRPRRLRALNFAGECKERGLRKRTVESVQARKQLLKKIVTLDGAQENDHNIVVVNGKEEELLPVILSDNINNKKQPLENKHRSILGSTILRSSSLIKKISIALDNNSSSTVDKVAEHNMAPKRPGVSDAIQVDGVFILGSPQPLNIRKLSEEYENQKQQSARSSPARQKQPPPTASTKEDHHAAYQHPPRTSSHRTHESEEIYQTQRPRANTGHHLASSTSSSKTHTSDDSRMVMGNFTDLSQSHDSPPTTSGSNREKVNMQNAAARFRREGRNPYEFRDSYDDPSLHRVTTVEDFLKQKFENTTREAANIKEVAVHPVVINRGVGPASATRGHVKNSNSESNAKYLQRPRVPEAPTVNSNHRAERAEYQQEVYQEHGLQRSRSSPAIGPASDPAPSRAVDSYAAYKDYGRHDQESDSDFYSRLPYVADRYDTPPSQTRGRNSQPRGLGIDTIQLQDAPREEAQNRVKTNDAILTDPFPAPKRSRSPMKRLFGPGGFLGNTGLPNSPADPQYVKPKTAGNMVTKIFKATSEKIAEIPRSLSPVKGVFKAEEKTIVRSKFPVSLSPPRQAKLYMELELLICATTNKFLMDQYRAGRMSTESVRKITEFWKNKGRPQVIEFQFDQATQRDLVVLNQRNFEFHGKGADNILQVNAMLHSWKENAREMAIRTFCMPDAVIQKQLRDSYRLLEMFGAPMSTFVALHEIHSNFNRYVKKSVDGKEQISAMIRTNDAENSVVKSPRQKAKSLQSQEGSRNVPRNSGEKPVPHASRPQSPERHAYGTSDRMYDAGKTPTAVPYPPRSPRHSEGSYAHQGHSRDGSRVAQTLNRDMHDPYSEQSGILDDYYPLRGPNHDQMRPRAVVEPRIQQDNYSSNNSFASRAADLRNKYSLDDSTTSYSSRASESRVQPDHRDSATSHPSQGSSSRGHHYDENLNPYSRRNYYENSSDRRGKGHQGLEDDDLDDLSSFGKYGAGL